MRHIPLSPSPFAVWTRTLADLLQALGALAHLIDLDLKVWVVATAEPGVDLDRVAEAAEGADRNRVGLIEGAVAFVDAQILTSSRGLC